MKLNKSSILQVKFRYKLKVRFVAISSTNPYCDWKRMSWYWWKWRI